ncbi:MAG: DUF2062 domain-containing protein [Thiobacillaceae bacterium]|nr:DUF2062 domain-containing protein [Thiobacillaceae bacterium]MCX7673435.1 DUF2062 domain-containing protein [Thiobacillaceae bacterium]MDW8323295.1 DUF2062 domain-containing protein [Burkholderiales bacterium]
MANKFIRRLLPHPERILASRSLRWLGPALHDPGLWRLNRRSVAGAVAVGAFFAFILPVAQFLAAGVSAVFLRVNLPVAVVSTLITNPLTFGPWYYLAYKIGAFILGQPAPANLPAAQESAAAGWGALTAGLDYVLSLGPPLAAGLALLAVASAALGYFLVHLLWRLPAYARLRRRMRRRTYGA